MAKIILVIFLGFMGICFAAATFFCYNKSQSLVQSGVSAKAVVVELVRSGKGFCPLLRFQTETGEVIEQKSAVGSNPPSFQKGQEVEVFYEKGNPSNFCPNSFLDLYFLPSLFGFFAAGLSIATCAVFCAMKPKFRF